MSETSPLPKWVESRLDEHQTKLHTLNVEQQVHAYRLKSHEDEMARLQQVQAEQHGRMMTKLDALSSNVSMALTDMHKRQGADGILRWLVPLIISIAALAIGYATFIN